MTEPLISLSLYICWYHQGFCRGMFMLPEWYRSTAQFVFPSLTLSDQYWPVWAVPAVDHSPLLPGAHSVDEMVCFTRNFPKALTGESYFSVSIIHGHQRLSMNSGILNMLTFRADQTCDYCTWFNSVASSGCLGRKKEQHKRGVVFLWNTHSALEMCLTRTF